MAYVQAIWVPWAPPPGAVIRVLLSHPLIIGFCHHLSLSTPSMRLSGSLFSPPSPFSPQLQLSPWVGGASAGISNNVTPASSCSPQLHPILASPLPALSQETQETQRQSWAPSHNNLLDLTPPDQKCLGIWCKGMAPLSLVQRPRALYSTNQNQTKKEVDLGVAQNG